MNRFHYVLAMFICDVVSFYTSFSFAYFTRTAINRFSPPLPFFELSAASFLSQFWMPLLFIGLIAYEGLYTRRLNFWNETKELIRAILLASVLMLSIITLAKLSHEVSRLFTALIFIYAIFIFPIARYLLKKALFRLGVAMERVMIVGTGEEEVRIARLLQKDRSLGFELVCFIGEGSGEIDILGRQIRVYRGMAHLERLIKVLKISTIVMGRREGQMNGDISTLQRAVRNIFMIPELEGIAMLNTELFSLSYEELPVLYIRNNLKNPVNVFIKYSFDIIFAVLMLPFLIPPMMVISLFIILSSKGAVFFTQKRVGKGGREFKVYKFRTMHQNSEEILNRYLEAHPEAMEQWKEFCKLRDDPRVTTVGRMLRRYSLDELPQIFNILNGDMSFVGPRPAFKSEIDKYYGELAYSYIEVRPGITGLWQVSGRNKLTMKDRARLEAFYVTNWSLWFDIVILLKTIKVVLKREGAY